jgi:hypothetical protein
MTSVSDITIAWPVLAVSGGVVIVLCFLWLLLLQWLAGTMVWVTITLVNLIMIVGGAWLYLYWQVQLIRYNDSTYNTTTTVTGLLATVNNFAQVSTTTSLLTKTEVDAISYAFVSNYNVSTLSQQLLAYCS